MVKNRKCLACEKNFSFCPNCSGADALKPSWASQFCSEDCMILWTTLTKYGINHMEKSEAKEIISGLDLKPIESYVACVQRDYEKVMAEEPKSKRGKRIEIKSIDEVMDEITDICPEQKPIIEIEHEVVITENE